MSTNKAKQTSLPARSVEYAIICHREDIRVRGNAGTTGDESGDRHIEDKIIKAVINGNQWRWCTIQVVARYAGFEGSDFLGCCSYASESDFKRNSGHYQAMKTNALAQLESQMRAAYGSLASYFGETI